MNEQTTLDQASFRRILARNVTLPLAAGVVGAAVFVGLILYLLTTLNLVEHTQRVIGKATEVSKLGVDLETGMRGFLLTGDDKFLASYEVGKPKMTAGMASLAEMVGQNPVQVDRLKRIGALQTEWVRFAQQAIELRRSNGGYVELVRSERGKQLFDEIRREFDDFIGVEERLRQDRSDEARRTTIGGVVLYLLFSLGLSAALSWFGRRELLHLSTTYGNTLSRQTEQAEGLARQHWLREGQSLLAEQVVGQLKMADLGRALLTFFSNRLDVGVAALYVRSGADGLNRVATYGFSEEAGQTEDSIALGAGLVGQAALEHRTIRLTELAPDYLRVNSALGHSAPKSIAVVPLDNDGEVNGVLELGFVRSITPRDEEFFKLIAGLLGAAVERAIYRQRLQEALKETQQLNEELQVQQEELRTANEELEEQSRALTESQVNLENQQAELEQSNEQLADQAQALDQRNSLLDQTRLELEQRAAELQLASRYKSEFLANMSHELRTPLNSSLILAKLLGDNPTGNLNDEQVRFAQSIHAAGNDLLNLINDILDISKVEAGKLELQPENVPLARLVESLKATFEPLAGQKGLRLTVALDPGAPATLHTDQQRAEQILKNLLSNAIKFTEAGEVALRVTGRPGGLVEFAVRDSGIGIAPDEQENIFEAFRQADGTTSRRYGGSGLGLSISRDLTRLLGGTLAVQSEPGKGSTFTLQLPVGGAAASAAPDGIGSPGSLTGTPGIAGTGGSSGATAAAAERARAAGPAGKSELPALSANAAFGAPPRAVAAPAFDDDRQRDSKAARTVLVVEDDPRFARILYDLAHEMKYRCLVARGAVEGFEMATAFGPDAILLDFGLPDRPGLALLHQLKEDSRTRHIPVHIVSAEDRSDTAMHMGAVGYATKPATREQLRAVFTKLEEKFTQRVKRVLLVEDDARQRDSIVHLIGDDDVEIVAVERGEQALAHLRTASFDCMIIDLKLPDMQGSELLRRMSSEETFSFPPVIVYTGRNLTRDEEAELLKYSRTIIIKGARSPERLLDEVSLFLHQVESKLSKERQTMLKSARSRDKVFDGRRILLVDDDVRNIFALTSALESKGLAVEIGRNGFEALDKLDQVADIDLVLMDVMMPGMDGLEATRKIRAQPRFRKLPIVAVTAKAMKDDQEQCLKAGASDYLAKPIDLDRLFSLMRVWLPNIERG
ncbi:MAG: response regulator [Pseudomonadota bacterium]|nr:response regulator [Pseudomonadota bacterium]